MVQQPQSTLRLLILLIKISADLNIYHSGSHSFIDDTGTGNLKLLDQII